MVMFIHQISFHSPYHQLFNFRFQFEKSVNSVWIHIYVLKAKCKCAMQQKERFLGTGWRVERRKVVLDGIYFHDLEFKTKMEKRCGSLFRISVCLLI